MVLKSPLVVCFLMIAHAAAGMASEPVVVAGPSALNQPQQPQVAIDASGIIHLAFGSKSGKVQGDIHYARSDDGGKSFSKPVNVGTVQGLALGMRRGPRIVISGDALCIAAISHKEGNILLFRS